jgi:hypothetical protein
MYVYTYIHTYKNRHNTTYTHIHTYVCITKIGTCGTLSEDEVKIMSGVLDMANKVAKDAMHRFRV